ncbi:MAG: DUF2358 domain-containing protein [Cyanobacteria bacterium J06648_11]
MSGTPPATRSSEPPHALSELTEILTADYRRFPQQQTFDIYADDVLFVDPLNRFRGVERYQEMISWMDRWFLDVRLELHDIRAELDESGGDRIRIAWTLHWRAPLPWKPAMAIAGWSELGVNAHGKIQSHTDYWRTPKWDVLKQVVFGYSPASASSRAEDS